MTNAIKTQYLSPNNTKGARIKATYGALQGIHITIPYDYKKDSLANHAHALRALVARMRTSGHAKFSPGWFDRGNKGCYYWTELTPIVYDQFTQEGHDNE